MQTRLMGSIEDGKAPSSAFIPNSTPAPARPLPLRLVQVILMCFVVGLGISIISMHAMKFLSMKHIASVTPFTIQACFQDALSIESLVRPPAELSHSMNDTELLWRASFYPKVKEYPFKRVPKVAFMFLTKGPLPLAPLWEKFFEGGPSDHYSIYVHSHPAYVANFTPSSVFYKRQIPSQPAEWGMMSMCEAERRLLGNALLDFSNEWFVLLSEACIPLQNFTVVYYYLSRSNYNFMGSYDDPGSSGRGRYNKNMEPVVTLDQWRKGSQWFEVNRMLAINIIEDITYYPKFRDFCVPACYVDEHYFPTMLTIQVPYLLANRTLTWTDWSRGGAHPATFGKEDITEEFLKHILLSETCTYNDQQVSLCFLFARKFAPSALEPLLELAPKVLGF
ncbi:glycosyltransferase BC10-like [Mangifera indica]|uniref:glycosyltransferase BC10-like n=1 Tax=Mangifera indica TaxID=29780 RepID=UPI001CFC3904|nr:glycosyltransferase BC10-like [Mangifera indica]